MSKIIQLLTLCLMVALAGCSGTLSPTGVYQGDKTLYNADLTFNAASATVEVFLKYELANRGTAAAPASLTAAADEIRQTWPKVHDAYYSGRDAYVANKSATNLTSFQKAVADAQAALNTASTFLSSVKLQPSNTST
jgi:hypothetical protein